VARPFSEVTQHERHDGIAEPDDLLKGRMLDNALCVGQKLRFCLPDAFESPEALLDRFCRRSNRSIRYWVAWHNRFSFVAGCAILLPGS
jgi:hypothetical protein